MAREVQLPIVRFAMIPVRFLIMSMGMLILLWPGRALANIGLPMVALYLPPA